MDLRLIRNATLRLDYGGVRLLVDPMLGVRDSIRPLGGQTRRNPTVDLPCPINEVIDGTDAVLVSHLHPDHFDEAAFGVVPRNLPLLCRAGDGATLSDAGFAHVVELSEPTTHDSVQITPTSGRHGTGSVGERMGEVIGVMLRAEGEPTVYWVGDSILCAPVLEVVEEVQPDVIITHSGGAVVGDTPIIMGPADTVEVARTAPTATVVAVHLEATSLCPATRDEVRSAADDAGVPNERLLIPADGETLTIV